MVKFPTREGTCNALQISTSIGDVFHRENRVFESRAPVSHSEAGGHVAWYLSGNDAVRGNPTVATVGLRDLQVSHQPCRRAIVNVGFRAVGSNSWSSALGRSESLGSGYFKRVVRCVNTRKWPQ
jgi:hypothetical protein